MSNHDTTYREQIFAALDADPSLAADTRQLYPLFDCARSTTRHYASLWRNRPRWAHDAAVDADGCDGCPHVAACWELYALDLPVLCERVTQDDVQAAERWAVLDAMQDARDAAVTP